MGWVTVAGALSGTLKQALSKRSLSHFLGRPRPGRCQWERGRWEGGEPGFLPLLPLLGGGQCEPTALPACPRAHQAAPGLGQSGEACDCCCWFLGSLPPVSLPSSSITCETISLY